MGGWGAQDDAVPAQPTVARDDDFGGWSSASPVAEKPSAMAQPTSASMQNGSASTTTTQAPKAFGGGGDDLFDNVWG